MLSTVEGNPLLDSNPVEPGNSSGNDPTFINTTAICTSTSSDCCWVVRSWQMMGQTIPSDISPTDNSCCSKSMDGVTCDGNYKITSIRWIKKGLNQHIPSGIGNLKSLTHL